MKYVHTNLIAKDWKKLSLFYQRVFNCIPVPPERDLSWEWLDELTGIKNAKIVWEHLRLPWYWNNWPTLEIFSYPTMIELGKNLNNIGFCHIAFEVDEVKETLNLVIENWWWVFWELVTKEYEWIGVATFVYCKDIEWNIIELQSWEK